MLDADLARLYGVETKVVLQAVKRNPERFPEDFSFQIDNQEFENLRSHFVTSNRGGRRYLPYAFTEQGVAMLSSVLRSPRAIQVNIEIMRAFVRLRRLLATNAELSRKLAALESKYDAQLKVVFDAIRELMKPPETFEPLFLERDVGGKRQVIVDEWCEGYVRGVALAESLWQAGGLEMTVLLAPIRAFTYATDWHAYQFTGSAEREVMIRE